MNDASRDAHDGSGHAGLRDVASAPDASDFHVLLRRLAPGCDASGAAYEQLRRRLLVLLRHHDPAQADVLADVALDRLARRVADGTIIDDPCGYVLGIARNLVLEAGNRRQREQRMLDDPTFPLAPAQPDHADERVFAAVEQCLDALPPAQRDLILAYYGADGAARIEQRQQLARECGISPNALRNRALRLREALERCARRRLAQGLARDVFDPMATPVDPGRTGDTRYSPSGDESNP